MHTRLEKTSTTLRRRWHGTVMVMALLTIAAPAIPVIAQNGDIVLTPGEELYDIRLGDGSELFARVTAVEGEMITLVTLAGARIEVDRSQIRTARRAEGRIVRSEFWREDPNLSRLFFAATGRTLPKGEAYFGTYVIVLPFFAVGLTDRVTLAGGAPVLFGEFEPFYVAPKVQVVRSSRANVSVGTLALFFDDEVVGVNYGVGTFGSQDHALTVGLGFGFSGDEFSGEPVAMIGGETRTSSRLKLVTENYFLPSESGVLFAVGLRFIGERFSTDLGIAGFVGGDIDECCLPLLNFSYALGGGR